MGHVHDMRHLVLKATDLNTGTDKVNPPKNNYNTVRITIEFDVGLNWKREKYAGKR